jgi:hypothetical protein
LTRLTKRMPLTACSMAVIATATCRTPRVMILDRRVGKGWKFESGFVWERSEGCKQPELTAYGCKQGDGHRKEKKEREASFGWGSI